MNISDLPPLPNQPFADLPKEDKKKEEKPQNIEKKEQLTSNEEVPLMDPPNNTDAAMLSENVIVDGEKSGKGFFIFAGILLIIILLLSAFLYYILTNNPELLEFNTSQKQSTESGTTTNQDENDITPTTIPADEEAQGFVSEFGGNNYKVTKTVKSNLTLTVDGSTTDISGQTTSELIYNNGVLASFTKSMEINSQPVNVQIIFNDGNLYYLNVTEKNYTVYERFDPNQLTDDERGLLIFMFDRENEYLYKLYKDFLNEEISLLKAGEIYKTVFKRNFVIDSFKESLVVNSPEYLDSVEISVEFYQSNLISDITINYEDELFNGQQLIHYIYEPVEDVDALLEVPSSFEKLN